MTSSLTDKSYLETGLPASLQKAIDDFLQGEKEQVLHLDCLSDEIYGAINSNLWSGCITRNRQIICVKNIYRAERHHFEKENVVLLLLSPHRCPLSAAVWAFAGLGGRFTHPHRIKPFLRAL
ncbi:hypothetical protein EDC19_2493 [Natranaerovirga hydrolytica]|uniref:Uncharacterized protein n=1 Tax=Natranaerovirga hydrolytica TaxID=680378 RepID=A0A4R1MG22_9FIRM|nr:hypothetical protein EDC19_2493 [Natranaerovirga hydrolytica]